MEKDIPRSSTFNVYLVAFAVISAQTGIGLAVFERFVYMHAKQDAWIAVLLAALLCHLTFYVITRTLQRYGNQDLYAIHQHVFGKWLGRLCSLIWIGYSAYAILIVIVTYYEILATYLFPEIPNWFVSAILLILTIYTVNSGIRVIIGLCFFSVLATIPMIVVLYQLFPYFDMQHFFPVLETGLLPFARAIYEMALSLAGFELIYFYYPYIDRKEKANRWGQGGLLVTNSFFFIVMVLALGFFGGPEVLKSAWPTLSMYKVIKYPFLEQFQVILLCLLLISILPILALYIWSLTKGLKKLFRVPQRQLLYAACAVFFVASLAFQTRMQIYNAGALFNKIAFVMVFVYPYILFVLTFFAEKIKKGKKKKQSTAEAESHGS